LTTEINGQQYLWQPATTDPLDLDDGFLFVLRSNEGEGDGPIVTGPADSFWPPGQWLNGETITGEDIVVWYVPILKTKQSDPWWCMPDPEPEYSPCNALLRIHPFEESAQSAEAAQVSPTPSPLVSPTPDPLPSATRTPAPTLTPRPIAGIDPETVILNSGCGSCHAIGQLGESGKVGPDLSNIGRVAADRNAGQSAEQYIRESIMNPSAILAPECPNGPCLDDIMPSDYVQRLSEEQIDTLVKFLLTQRLPVPVSEDPDIAVTAVAEDPAREVIATPAVSTEKLPVVPLITIGMVVLILVLSLAIVVLLMLLRSSSRNQDS
jgi:cytochrome c551/c552